MLSNHYLRPFDVEFLGTMLAFERMRCNTFR